MSKQNFTLDGLCQNAEVSSFKSGELIRKARAAGNVESIIDKESDDGRVNTYFINFTDSPVPPGSYTAAALAASVRENGDFK